MKLGLFGLWIAISLKLIEGADDGLPAEITTCKVDMENVRDPSACRECCTKMDSKFKDAKQEEYGEVLSKFCSEFRPNSSLQHDCSDLVKVLQTSVITQERPEAFREMKICELLPACYSENAPAERGKTPRKHSPEGL